MQKFGICLVVVTLAICVSCVQAQEQNSPNTFKLGDSPQAAATIQDVAWLSGYWQGEGLGGWCEEMWGHPIGDRMYGTFTLRKDDEVVFSEHLTIVEEAGSLVMKVKHFTADFVGWESKEDYVRFPLVKLEDNAAYFSGLTLRRLSPDSLKIYLVLSQGGERTEQVFDFKAVRL